MSSSASNSCHSCFAKYDTKSRQAKILQCYHTYCRQCLEQYMYSNGVVTCLSCGRETAIKSVDLIPNNPYLGDSDGASRSKAAEDSGHGEELYYSDSDEDDLSAASSGNAASASLTPVPNGAINSNHIEGVKAMVLNTQRANIGKTQQLIQQNINKVQQCKQVRLQKEARLKESLEAAKQFKEILSSEHEALKKVNGEIDKIENRVNNLQIQLSKINPLDYKYLKSVHEECLSLNDVLSQTLQKNERFILEEAVRQSTITINFDKADAYIKQLAADKDTIFMKLSTVLEKDPSHVFLTTNMLATIFSEKIAAHNTKLYEHLNKKTLAMAQSLPGPLDDPSGYIDYINSFQSLNVADKGGDVESNGFRSSEAPKTVQESDTSRSDSPASENWKIVGKTAKKEVKKVTPTPAPLSFSEMAKKPGVPNPAAPRLSKKTVGATNRPRCYFKIQVDNETPFRVVFEMRPDMAPKMCDNFMKLCEGTADGVGYKGSRIFRAKANDHILGGDFEFNNGSGGYSAFPEKYFMAEQCPLKDHKGAIRMKGLERTDDGRCKIGSQFMIWVGDLEYKEYRYTLVFGEVVEGFEQLQEVSRIKAVQKTPTSWILRQQVLIIDSGVL